MRIRRIVFAQFALACLLLTAVGCGSTGELSGTVTYQKKPLRYGAVAAVGSDGIQRTSGIKEDGTYHIKDIPTGSIKLTVSSPDPATSQPAPRKKDEKQPKVDNKGWFAIPEKYADLDKSGLTHTLSSGKNTKDIDLQ